jgi:hypothetical protein
MRDTIQPEKIQTRDKWSRADKVSFFAAVVACLVAAVPYAVQGFRYLERPRVTIISPKNGARENANTLGVNGTAQNIPQSSDSWLVVRAGVEGRWYPFERVRLAGDRWAVKKDRICPGSGPQDIEIFLLPDTDEGQLFAYARESPQQRKVGINSMLPTRFWKRFRRFRFQPGVLERVVN